MIINVTILVVVLGVGSSQTMSITPMPNMETCKVMAAQAEAEMPRTLNPVRAYCLESKP